MGFKSVLKKVGKVALKVAPYAAMAIPGVGPLAALGIRAGIGAAQGAASGGGWKGAALGGGLGAIPGGGGKVAQSLIGAGSGALQSALTGGGVKGSLLGAGLGAAGGAAGGGKVSGGAVGGGLKQGLITGLKEVGKQEAVGAGSNLAASKLGGTGGALVGQGIQTALGKVPGLSQPGQPQGGNVFSNFLPSGSTTPGAMPNWRSVVQQGLTGAATGAATGGGVRGALTGATNAVTGRPTLPGTGVAMSAAPGGARPAAGGAPSGPSGTGSPAVEDDSGGGGIDWGQIFATGAGAGAGIAAGKLSEKSAMKRSPEEQAALAGAQGAAGTLGKTGADLVNESKPYLGQAGQYYQTLLHGNRGAMSAAVAPYAAKITDTYRGANRALEQSGVRGAARDVQSGELNRQRASQIAGLTTGMQPQAAGALGALGTTQLQAGTPLLGQAGGIYANLLGQGTQNRKYGREEGEKMGTQVGQFTYDIAKQVGQGRGTGKGKSQAPVPSSVRPGNTTQPVQGSRGTPMMGPYAGPVGLQTPAPQTPAYSYDDQYYGQ